jgi:hypothetical protein
MTPASSTVTAAIASKVFLISVSFSPLTDSAGRVIDNLGIRRRRFRARRRSSRRLPAFRLDRLLVLGHFNGLFFLPSSQSNKITSTSDDSDRLSCFAALSIAFFTAGSTRAPNGIFVMSAFQLY